MLQQNTRQLHPEEKEYLEAQIWKLKKRQQFQRWVLAVATGFLVVATIFLWIWFRAELNLVLTLSLFGLLLFFLLTLLWSYLQGMKSSRQLQQSCYNALTGNQAEVTACSTEKVATISPSAMQGPDFFFDTGNGKILWVDGAAFPLSERFPNSDFELVQVYDAEGLLVYHTVSNRGVKIEPVETLPKSARKAFYRQQNGHKNHEIFKGDLGNLQQLLARPEPLAR